MRDGACLSFLFHEDRFDFVIIRGWYVHSVVFVPLACYFVYGSLGGIE